MFGWAEHILRVDLKKKELKKEPLKLDFAKAFLGGRGFNSKIIYDEFNPKIKDPYSPENIVCVSTGLLAGTLAPSAGRLTISVARSPITGVFGDGNAGGHFSSELKYTGCQTIVIKGASNKPVYLWIQDEDVELRDANHLWGKDVWETDKMIKKDTGDPETQVLTIGPAGEKRVAVAIPICNLSRAPGGCGTGAVLGSKNLKAIAVRGTKGIKIANPEVFMDACKESYAHLKSHPIYEAWSTYGTPVLLGVYQEQVGALPTKNWLDGDFPDYQGIDGSTFVNKYSLKSKGCFGCSLHCSHYYVVKEGPYAGTKGEGPEYEATDGFGARCGIGDLAAVLTANTLVNKMGMCVVQASNIVGVAMHLWQDGIVDPDDTGGLILEWGNDKAMIELLRQTAYREGFGEIWADGVLQGVRNIAKKKKLPPEKLDRYVIHVKGMTLSSFDPRPFPGFTLTMATSTRGADHLRGLPTIEGFIDWYKERGMLETLGKTMGIPDEIFDQWKRLGILNQYEYEGKEYLVKYFQDQCTISDLLENCKLISSWRLGVGPERMARLVSTLTGIKYTWKDLMKIGERVYTLEYAMQRRYGLGRKDDYPPERFYEPLRSGKKKGFAVDKNKYDKLLTNYYSLRGYDEEGIPTRKKLEELGLEDVADDLEKRGMIS